MGYSLSWLAVRGKAPQAVLEQLNLQPTRRRVEFCDVKYSAAQLPNGWYLIVADREDRVATDAVLQSICSTGCELVSFSVEDHVMYCSAAGWRDGRKVWSVIHESEKGLYDLQVRGEPPPEFPAIAGRLKGKQQEEDASEDEEYAVDFIIEIPAELAKSVVGFRHDGEAEDMQGLAFEALSAPKKSMLQRLFGR